MRGEQVQFTPNSTTEAIEPTMRYLNLFALFAIAMPPALALAGAAANPGAFAMSQSGAQVASTKRLVEDKKEQRENSKESAK